MSRALAASIVSTVVGGLSLAVNLPAVASAAPVADPPTARPWETLQSADGVGPAPTAPRGVAPWTVAGDGEVAALRTQMTRTYARADGRFRTVSSPVPVNFRNAQGEWTPIDDTLVRQPSGVYGVAADS